MNPPEPGTVVRFFDENHAHRVGRFIRVMGRGKDKGAWRLDTRAGFRNVPLNRIYYVSQEPPQQG